MKKVGPVLEPGVAGPLPSGLLMSHMVAESVRLQQGLCWMLSSHSFMEQFTDQPVWAGCLKQAA